MLQGCLVELFRRGCYGLAAKNMLGPVRTGLVASNGAS
jgi:hypothetical protein